MENARFFACKIQATRAARVIRTIAQDLTAIRITNVMC
jgi:hypothetical protein